MAKQDEYKQDARVFGLDGREAWYQAKVPGGHLVYPIVVDDEDEYAEPAEIWQRVFDKAPAPKFAKDIEALHKQIAELQAQRSALADACSQQLHEKQSFEAAKKKHPILAQLAAVLEGHVTHVVWHHYHDVEITAVTDRFANFSIECNDNRGTMRFFARVRGDCSTLCTPCTSEEQALAVARELAAAKVAEAARSGARYYGGAIELAQRFYIPVPKKMLEDEAWNAQQTLAESTKRLAEAQASLDEARAYADECAARAKA